MDQYVEFDVLSESDCESQIANERRIATKQIEEDVEALNETMTMTAQLVQKQSEPLDNIESNISSAVESSKIANQHLCMAEQYETRRRWRNVAVAGFTILATAATACSVYFVATRKPE